MTSNFDCILICYKIFNNYKKGDIEKEEKGDGRQKYKIFKNF